MNAPKFGAADLTEIPRHIWRDTTKGRKKAKVCSQHYLVIVSNKGCKKVKQSSENTSHDETFDAAKYQNRMVNKVILHYCAISQIEQQSFSLKALMAVRCRAMHHCRPVHHFYFAFFSLSLIVQRCCAQSWHNSQGFFYYKLTKLDK